MDTASTLGLIYVAIGFLVGTLTWLSTARTWDPNKNGSLRGHVARSVVVTVVCGVMWPGTLLIVVAWRTRSGRRWLIRYLKGDTADDPNAG